MDLKTVCLAIVLLPLVASLIAGILGFKIGRVAAHRLTITAVGIAFLLALTVAKSLFIDHAGSSNIPLYTWGISGHLNLVIGFLIDPLSTMMMVTVLFVSFLVHIYSIGYMSDDPGYQRFFSYISAFTFAMLILVLSNNFLGLFFGWEGVGVVSYLLIGFWFRKNSATDGSLKAFLVNRVGDFGFILGIGAILAYFGSLNYADVFSQVQALADRNEMITLLPHLSFSVITVICILLFIGAMGKSAQVPLHVWLPESMEGPTPISALIHAATMVTAGIYMVSRMSPLFELSQPALTFILVIGSSGALFLGLIAIVQNDIKRVVAYSTLSQLGYMMAALGASAFAAGLFHLFTHACFKALLFLGAGSVIIAMHHEQDMRKMGGLYKYMPITYLTFLIGSLSLAAIPPFAGFFSKDAIIEAVGETTIPGGHYAYICVLLGSFVTALYTFRMFFLTFHSEERFDDHTREHLHETPWVVWLPLAILAIPSVVLGALLIEPLLYGPHNGILGDSITVADKYNVLIDMAQHYTGLKDTLIHSVFSLPFWFAIAGFGVAFVCYQLVPTIPARLANMFKVIYQILMAKYGFDKLNDWLFVRGARELGQTLYQKSDLRVIDGIVNGSGKVVVGVGRWLRKLQSGFMYHYAFVMVVCLLGFLALTLAGGGAVALPLH